MAVDIEHGRLENGVLKYAELPLHGEGTIIFNPTDEIYLSHGLKRVIDVEPVPGEGFHVEENGFDESETQIVVKYKIVEDPPGPHTYRRSYIAQWLREKGFWAQFKTLLAQSEDLEFMWETCTEFDSDHPMWDGALQGVREAFSLTDEDVDELLYYGEHGRMPED